MKKRKTARMKTEKQKMLAGEPYRPGDAQLCRDRSEAQRLMSAYNNTIVDDADERISVLKQLLGSMGDNVAIRAPICVDYGYNIFLGNGVFLNFGCVFLDVCRIEIGDGTQVGPGVQFYSADHPRDPGQRAEGIEYGKGITIGRNVWIGGHAIILPGVTIGDDAIIGAGSVVTRDVQRGATVVGNPAKMLQAGP